MANKKDNKSIALVIGVVIFCLLIVVSVSAWTGPPAAGPPPALCPSGWPGCDEPINVSGTGQVKLYVDGTYKGWLGVATNAYDSNYGLTVGNSSNQLGIKTSGDSLLERDVSIGYDGQNATHTLTIWSENGRGSVIKLMEANNYGMGIRYPATENKLYIDRYNGSTSHIPVVTIQRSDGNVGIPTANSSYKLNVTGKTNSTELCVNASCIGDWSDLITGGVGAPNDASYVVADLDSDLSNERKIVGGTNISIDYGVANGNLTINNTGDPSSTNEIQDVITDKGLQKVSDNFGLINCADGEVLKYNALGQWGCAADDTTGGGAISGLGTATQVAFFDSANSITSESKLYWNNVSKGLGVGTDSIDANYKITTLDGGIKAVAEPLLGQPAGYFDSDSGYGLLVDDGNVGIGTLTPLSTTNNDGLQIDKGSATTLLIGHGSAYGGVLQAEGVQASLFLGANMYDDLSTIWTKFDAASGYAGFRPSGTNARGSAEIMVGSPSDTSYDTDNVAFEAYKSDTKSYVSLDPYNEGFNVGIGNSNPAYDLDMESGGTISLNDGYLRNAKGIYLKDWDDDTGGSDDKYRLLGRDGAWQFFNGGVVVGSYPNGTWSDVPDGRLIAEESVRAPIFYDQNNTSYYANPAGTSNFDTLDVEVINLGEEDIFQMESVTWSVAGVGPGTHQTCATVGTEWLPSLPGGYPSVFANVHERPHGYTAGFGPATLQTLDAYVNANGELCVRYAMSGYLLGITVYIDAFLVR